MATTTKAPNTREEAEALLKPLRDWRKMASDAGKEADKARDALLAYHAEHPEEEIVDGELGIAAVFAPQKETTTDFQHMPNELVLWMAANGLLNLNMAVYRALLKSQGGDRAMLDQLTRFVIEGEKPSPKLNLEERS